MKTKQHLLTAMTIIGLLLSLMGIFHIIHYLADNKPLFTGVRYLNWIASVVGLSMLSFGYWELGKIR